MSDNTNGINKPKRRRIVTRKWVYDHPLYRQKPTARDEFKGQFSPERLPLDSGDIYRSNNEGIEDYAITFERGHSKKKPGQE